MQGIRVVYMGLEEMHICKTCFHFSVEELFMRRLDKHAYARAVTMARTAIPCLMCGVEGHADVAVFENVSNTLMWYIVKEGKLPEPLERTVK